MTLRILSRLRHDERGFSLIEAAVAMGIVFVSLVVLAGMTAGAARDIGFARQRQGANQIANQLLEEVRGLAYSTLKLGHKSSDLSGDANIVNCSGTRYFKACPSSDPNAEKLIVSSGIPDVTPLVPHTGTYGPPLYPSTYSWAVYVTEAVGVPSSGAYRLTAIVSWNNAQRQGLANSVQAQTLIFSPEGCTSPSTHPFAAPCEVYFRGFGSLDPGSVTTSGTIAGVTFDSMIAHLASARADVQVEQVTMVNGESRLPGGERISGGETTGAGLTTDSSSADNDPSSAATGYESSSSLLQAGGDVVASGGANEIRVSVAGGDSGKTISTIAASTTNACNSQIDGRPCAYSETRHSGSVTQTLTLGSGVGTAALVSVGTQASPSTIYGRRFVSGAGGTGLVRETVTRRLPTVSLGGLPSGVAAPSGWAGHWARITGYQATATAEAGAGTATPAVTFSGGTVQVWNGSGYTSVPVNAAGVDELTIAPVSVTSGAVTVDVSGSLSIGPVALEEAIVSGSERSLGSATAESPLSGTISYEVTVSGVSQASLVMKVDLGAAVARTAYEPAPES